MMKEHLKLSELNGRVKKTIGDTFTAPVWVIGEISELKTNRSGHCYLVLVEKEENGDAIIAQTRATIWSYTFRMLQPYFETSTGQQFTEGLKVLVSVSVEFHELYGFSLNIRDIDPVYTMGDMARRRREIIARLKAEGVADMNKELSLPLVPQRIAVISSPTAAGYGDFIDQLTNNADHYKFQTRLFPAVMQGNQAESSIIEALEQIYAVENLFDAVAIIRGGGSQADLSCFDNYNLAYFITQFPLPVITGIGHEKDDSIVDLVAHTRLKTPTAVAEFLISGVKQFDNHLIEVRNQILIRVKELLDDAKNEIDIYTRNIIPFTRDRITKANSRLSKTIWKLDNHVRIFIQGQDNQLEKKEKTIRLGFNFFTQQQRRGLEKTTRMLTSSLKIITQTHHDQLKRKGQRTDKLIRAMLSENRHFLDMSFQKAMLTDPEKILARGYSITTFNGRALKNVDNLDINSVLETTLYRGKIISEIKTILKDNSK